MGKPRIQREMWRDAVLVYDERSDAKAICAKLLNTTVARRMITKSECMVEAGNLPPWAFSGKFERSLFPVSGSSREKAKQGRIQRRSAITEAGLSQMDMSLSLYEYV